MKEGGKEEVKKMDKYLASWKWSLLCMVILMSIMTRSANGTALKVGFDEAARKAEKFIDDRIKSSNHECHGEIGCHLGDKTERNIKEPHENAHGDKRSRKLKVFKYLSPSEDRAQGKEIEVQFIPLETMEMSSGNETEEVKDNSENQVREVLDASERSRRSPFKMRPNPAKIEKLNDNPFHQQRENLQSVERTFGIRRKPLRPNLNDRKQTLRPIQFDGPLIQRRKVPMSNIEMRRIVNNKGRPVPRIVPTRLPAVSTPSQIMSRKPKLSIKNHNRHAHFLASKERIRPQQSMQIPVLRNIQRKIKKNRQRNKIKAYRDKFGNKHIFINSDVVANRALQLPQIGWRNRPHPWPQVQDRKPVYRYPKSAQSIQDILNHMKTEKQDRMNPISDPGPSKYPDLSSEFRDVQKSLLKDIKEFSQRPYLLNNPSQGASFDYDPPPVSKMPQYNEPKFDSMNYAPHHDTPGPFYNYRTVAGDAKTFSDPPLHYNRWESKEKINKLDFGPKPERGFVDPSFDKDKRLSRNFLDSQSQSVENSQSFEASYERHNRRKTHRHKSGSNSRYKKRNKKYYEDNRIRDSSSSEEYRRRKHRRRDRHENEHSKYRRAPENVGLPLSGRTMNKPIVLKSPFENYRTHYHETLPEYSQPYGTPFSAMPSEYRWRLYGERPPNVPSTNSSPRLPPLIPQLPVKNFESRYPPYMPYPPLVSTTASPPKQTTPKASSLDKLEKEVLEKIYIELLKKRTIDEITKSKKTNESDKKDKSAEKQATKSKRTPMRMKIHIYPNNPMPTIKTERSDLKSSHTNNYYDYNYQKNRLNFDTYNHSPYRPRSSTTFRPRLGQSLETLEMDDDWSTSENFSLRDRDRNVILHLHVHKDDPLRTDASYEMQGSSVKPQFDKASLGYQEIYEGDESDDNSHDQSVSIELPIQTDKIRDVLQTLLKLREARRKKRAHLYSRNSDKVSEPTIIKRENDEDSVKTFTPNDAMLPNLMKS